MKKLFVSGLICFLLCLVSCEKGQESVTAPSDGSCDGYYLSEAFDSHSGYAFPKDEGVRSTEGKDYYYQYYLTEVTGMRE